VGLVGQRWDSVAFVGLRWALVDLRWPSLSLLWAFVGLRWPSQAICIVKIDKIYFKKKSVVLNPSWASLASGGTQSPSLACAGHWLAFVDLHRPSVS
jgi:hypothetical protein